MSEVQTIYHFDGIGHNKNVIVERIQDVEPILENNKKLRGEKQKSDWGRHVATIPNVVLEQWLNDEMKRGNTTIRWGSKEFDELIHRKIQDRDWLFLRTDK